MIYTYLYYMYIEGYDIYFMYMSLSHLKFEVKIYTYFSMDFTSEIEK